MKIYTKVKIDMNTGEIIAEDGFEYDGPLALAVDASYTAGYEPSSSSYTAGYEPSSSSTNSNKSNNNDDAEDSSSSEFNGSFRGNYDLGANKYISSFKTSGKKWIDPCRNISILRVHLVVIPVPPFHSEIEIIQLVMKLILFRD